MQSDIQLKVTSIIKKQAPGIEDPAGVADQIINVFRTFTQSRWLKFDRRVRKHGHTTDTFDVYSKISGYKVGIVKWSSEFKSYAFFPENDSCFETTIMADIVAFLHSQMTEWRELRNKAKVNADDNSKN